MKWEASAPSNLALIKYIGKSDSKINLPCNASLSYTLDRLTTTVELQLNEKQIDVWIPLEDQTFSTDAINRFLNHLEYLKEQFKYDGAFIVKSTNNFPSDCGLASSASSFAALTTVAVSALTELSPQNQIMNPAEMAQLSRMGSGSSCRSFFSPWALWESDKIGPVTLPYKDLIHRVVIVSRAKKAVSSSEAHKRVVTSPLFKGRVERAETRLKGLVASLQAQNWNEAFTIIWDEFLDMHQLFETSKEPFSYIEGGTRQVLNTVKEFWHANNDGPLVTMDAGPNVHLLFRTDQQLLSEQLVDTLTKQFEII